MPEAARQHRRADIELLRVVCAFGIVWFHSGIPGTDVAYSALLVLIAISVYLSAGHAGPLVEMVRLRGVRLLVPWATWLLFFGVLNWMHGRPLFPFGQNLPAAILAGSSAHLWFLPFIFLALMLIHVARSVLNKRLLALLSAGFFAAALIGTPYWRIPSMAAGYPVAQYVHALPAVALGLFLSASEGMRNKARLLGLALLLGSALTQFRSVGVGLPYSISVLVCGLFLLRRHSSYASRWLVRLASLTFGVYLLHPFFFAFSPFLINLWGVARVIFVFLASIASVAALRKFLPRLGLMVT